jgi:quercetin 2,3-dioxygenase
VLFASVTHFTIHFLCVVLKWMTAGRGIVHSEMPNGDGINHGLQLWVNLARKDKMVEPAYQELLSMDIPTVTRDGITVRVIAGESLGAKVCNESI